MSKEHDIIESVAKFVKQKHGMNLTKQEKIYLIIHIHRILGGNR